jgi:GNAT superfamily N-acetyltransferase
MQIQLRDAVEADMRAIHGLVYQLAVYEREPEAVVTTPEEYLEDFRNGLFGCRMAEVDGEPVGMTLFYMAYSTWRGKMLYLEDFIVNEAWRGKGIGQLLYDDFIALGQQKGCRLVKWQVLDWNDPAVRFYERQGAEIEKGWWNVKYFNRR